MMKKSLPTLVALCLICSYGFALELEDEIVIAAEDLVCESDKDCTVVETSCWQDTCECGGKPANKQSKSNYEELLSQCRKSIKYALKTCEMECAPRDIRCLNDECTVTWNGRGESPRLKSTQVMRLAENLAAEKVKINGYRTPRITYDYKRRDWTLFYNGKGKKDEVTGEILLYPGNHFMIRVNDENEAVEFVPGR